uniref:Uncharacterized protein n=1 Tax=Arundo donax TaxID=35708 RepID=A0A0A9HSS0_ARUDO
MSSSQKFVSFWPQINLQNIALTTDYTGKSKKIVVLRDFF